MTSCVARRGDMSQAEVGSDFDISVESVRRWNRQADIDEGVVNGQTSAEQRELVQLRREKCRLGDGDEILRAASHLAGIAGDAPTATSSPQGDRSTDPAAGQ